MRLTKNLISLHASAQETVSNNRTLTKT